MVVPAHALVAPRGVNGRLMVVSSLLLEHFNVFYFSFFLGSVHDMKGHEMVELDKHLPPTPGPPKLANMIKFAPFTQRGQVDLLKLYGVLKHINNQATTNIFIKGQ